MGRWKTLRKQLWWGIGVVVCIMAIPPLASPHGGDEDVIHACVTSKGKIRIVDPDGSCKPQEEPLDWNIQGPQGPPGPMGPPGPPSDERLKSEVRPLTQVLEKLEKIRGVSFEWNELYKSMGRSTGHREIGVIAQEVEAVFPELVTTWGDEGYRAVDYGRLTAVLLEAVKELKAQTNAQRQHIGALEARLAGLEQEVRGGRAPVQLSSFGLPTGGLLLVATLGLLGYGWRRWKQ